ncbi:Uncharacterised protein [Burkholderia pseudomallei]|nr:Uncharacterised protein [Burkholderia pseudomallei]
MSKNDEFQKRMVAAIGETWGTTAEWEKPQTRFEQSIGHTVGGFTVGHHATLNGSKVVGTIVKVVEGEVGPEITLEFDEPQPIDELRVMVRRFHVDWRNIASTWMPGAAVAEQAGKLPERPSWAYVCEHFGLDESFQYSDAQRGEYFRLLSQDHVVPKTGGKLPEQPLSRIELEEQGFVFTSFTQGGWGWSFSRPDYDNGRGLSAGSSQRPHEFPAADDAIRSANDVWRHINATLESAHRDRKLPETVRMAVKENIFVDDDGRKSVQGYWVVDTEDDGSVCGVASGTVHATREGAEKEIANLNRSADRKLPQSQSDETVTAWRLRAGDRIITRTWPEGRLIVNTEPGLPQPTKIRLTYEGNGEIEDREVFGASDAVVVRRKLQPDASNVFEVIDKANEQLRPAGLPLYGDLIAALAEVAQKVPFCPEQDAAARLVEQVQAAGGVRSADRRMKCAQVEEAEQYQAPSPGM